MSAAERAAVLAAAAKADTGCEHCCAQVLGTLFRLLPDEPWQEALDIAYALPLEEEDQMPGYPLPRTVEEARLEGR